VPQFAHIGANEMHKVGTYQEWYTCDIYPFVRDLSPEQCLRRARQHLAENDLVIIVNHYWTFFYDWQPDGWTEMMAAWNQFVDDLLTLKDAKFKTFSDFKYWNNL